MSLVKVMTSTLVSNPLATSGQRIGLDSNIGVSLYHPELTHLLAP